MDTRDRFDGEHVGGVPAALRRRWLTALLVLLLVGGAGITAARLYPTSWAATAIVSFTPRPEVGIPVDTVALVAQRYAVVVTSDASAQRITAEVPGTTTDEIADAIAAELETGTGNLRITVQLPDRALAAAAANAAARELVDEAADDDLVHSDLSAAATERGAALMPPRLLLYAGAVLAAVLAAVVVGVLVDRFALARRRRASARPADAAPTGARRAVPAEA
jgi:capsular polysaccharide biosynthesis protein